MTRTALASRIKWDLIELLSETDSPVLPEELMDMLDAIDRHMEAMSDRSPEVEPRD